MSVWTDMEDRGSGTTVKKEDQVQQIPDPIKPVAPSDPWYKSYKPVYDTMDTLLAFFKIFLIAMCIILLIAIIWVCSNAFGFLQTMVGFLAVLTVLGISSLIYLEFFDY